MKPLFSFFCLCFLVVFSSNGQIQQGEASFYKDVFEGRKTASGELFQQALPTAAHRSLAFGTKLKITNKTNGKTAEVTVNDRGPYIRNRIIDVSKSVAEQLGFVEDGTTQVEIEVLEFPSETDETYLGEVNSTPKNETKEKLEEELLTADIEQKLIAQIQKQATQEQFFNLKAERVKPSFYAVQLASFSEASNALSLGKELEKSYKEQVTLRYKLLDKKALYTLILGKLENRNQAEKLLSEVKDRYPDAFIANLKI
ncbi:septal ring lytic transglycosylase RlpA family protein [Psychroflexus planctonicus]|uniref:Probable endolytic peptidoglycan transglycosylase RlpA n=1 Tax=Psychroflexus planctonicus TaxID=1526575 RepID=A0ABQ1SCR2_9FLAO|nr:septal ring lytic transglycosylase RlpA family protein [Psychroflexus planctonicus]GGE28783.1 hypothetical protein GCM10010832_06770 [Psychroflexus planctonicus]